MTAKIRGSVATPNQTPVRVSINAAPVPAPGNAGNGAVIIPGDIVVDQTSPVDVDVLPGTYRLTVYAPTQMLTARTVTLKDGDVLELTSLLGGAPGAGDAQAPGVALIDGDGKLVACANIQVVRSREEADALPDGTVYILAASAPTPPAPNPGGGPGGAVTPPPPAPEPPVTPTAQLIDHAAGQMTGDEITVLLNGQAGDRAVVAINTKAIPDQTFTWPEGWQVLTEPYYIGTMRFTVASGPWANDITVRTSKPVEAGWGAFTVRGGGAPVIGAVKDRTKDPKETVTVTAPPVDGATGLAFAFGFERTSKPETQGQLTLSTGWEMLDFGQEEGGVNYQTVVLAQWKGTGNPTALTVTYPNDQATNGAGVQVVVPNV